MTALVTFEQLSTNVTSLLSADGDVAAQAGAGAMAVLGSGAAAEGDRVGGFVTLSMEACVLAIARGTAGVEDLDILAFDDGGTSLVADQSVGPKPAVMVCPPHPARIYFAARVASGSGLIALGVQEVAPSRSAAVASRLAARMSGLGGDLSTRAAWTGLDAKVEAHRRALGGRWEELRRVTLPVNQRAPSYVSMPLGANRCLDVYVLPNDEVRNLDVTVADDNGREIARASSLGDDRAALVCTPVDVTLSIALRPHQGFGLAAVIVSRSAPGSESELAVRPETRRVAPMTPLPQVRAKLADALAPLAYDKPKIVAEGFIEAGKTFSYPVSLPAGCSRIDVMVGAPMAGVLASLWTTQHDMIASTSAGEYATLHACVASAIAATLDVEGVGRPGAVAVELRREKDSPPELTRHPVAASRLLSRAAPGAPDLRTLRPIHEVDLEEGKRATLDVAVTPPGCGEVVAAVDTGCSGITLRLVDGQTGQEVSKGAGARVASARVCGEGGTRAIKALVSPDVGKCSALVTRLPDSP